MGVNAAGLRSKMSCFKKVLNDLKPSVFFIQESKMKIPGKINIENYIIFEKLRSKNENGGGLAIGCIPELKPCWVRESEEPIEALSIDIFFKNLTIRCCVAYGCQENDAIGKKEEFWEYLDNEVIEANKSGSGLMIQMDGNLWAGDEIIPNDPRPQNRNGALFEQFLKRNPNLNVVNSLELCEGLITRRRVRNGNVEESVLDLFIVCDIILPYVTRMVIDEKKDYVLTNYEQVKRTGRATDTDHATEFIDLALEIVTEKPKRTEIWNLKNKKGQETFRFITENTDAFSQCFQNELPLQKQIKNWKSILSKVIGKAFKKIRIRNRPKIQNIPPKLQNLISLRNKTEDKQNRNELEKAISDIEAKLNRDKIVKNFRAFSDDPEKINRQQMWKTLNKLWPKVESKMPSAKKNHKGQIISEPNALKKLLAKEYRERLRERPVRPDFDNLEIRKKKIFKQKLQLASLKKSRPWTMQNLETALADLKIGRSRDPEGLINEIFKKNVIGKDLKNSLLIMFNEIKKHKYIPEFMNLANITTVPKKGSKLQLENERGIFRVSVLRSILMRLVYNEKYENIDKNMTDCQMGGRKQRGCRNNILIINGIIYDALFSKKKSPVVLQIYDYRQMFDAIGLEEALSDVYDVGVDDESLVLLHKANKDINMAVKTNNGLTERQNVENLVLQGDTFGSILASVQVDNICKSVESSGHGIKYKNVLDISVLALVDDMLGVTEPGYKAQQMNAVINAKTAEKRLQFGVSKCKTMIIGDIKHLVNNNLSVDNWKIRHTDKENEDLVETFDGKTTIEETDKYKYLGFLLSNRGDNMINIKEMRKKSIWVTNKIFNRLNSLNLNQYFFECGLIFLNVILRSTILYAAETYYNIKENELRMLERIEEQFLRKLLKTGRGCPVSQLYLETGHIPARFAVMKLRCLFLKTILDENTESLIYRFVMTQYENPIKGDWMSSCLRDLKYLNISLTIENIKAMKKNHFKRMLKESIENKARQYLLDKRGSKGIQIKYSSLKMAEYLLPNHEKLSISEQRYIFAIRNRMVHIENNFPNQLSKSPCICGEFENQEHIYSCTLLNQNKVIIEYDRIFEENVKAQKQIYERFKENLEIRNEKTRKNSHPSDPQWSIHYYN